MRRFITATALIFVATAAAAAPTPSIQTTNQFLEPGEASLTINHVALPRAGHIVAVAPDAYGRADDGRTLGEVPVAAGEHSRVRLPIDSRALASQHYTPGSNHQVILEVRDATAQGRPAASQPIKVRIPDPADEVD